MNSYIVVGCILLVLVFISLLSIRRRRITFTKSAYIDALHALIEGKMDTALEGLKKTVKNDTENIKAYIALGDIFCRQGHPLRAIKIHRNLLIRSNLSEDMINTTLHHLIIDYQKANMLDKAIEMAERLAQRKKKDEEIQRLLLALYEEKGDWDKAFFTRQNINKWFKTKDQNILALYKVQSGLEFIKRGIEREARIRFREAIKLDKKCVPAYIYWEDSYKREGRIEDAYKIWHDYTLKIPEWGHLVFDRLRDILYELGRYGEMESIYQKIIQSKPKNPAAYINLMDMYLKQGETDKALDECQKILESRPELSQCRYVFVKVLKQKGEHEQALNEAMQILDKAAKKTPMFYCSECGYEISEPIWYCPECHQWNTFLNEN